MRRATGPITRKKSKTRLRPQSSEPSLNFLSYILAGAGRFQAVDLWLVIAEDRGQGRIENEGWTARGQEDQVVLVQKDASPSDLRAKQVIAVIYAEGADGPVLLSAVAQPVADK